MSRNQWRTAIAQGSVDTIRIRGYDLRELIGRVSFAEAFLLLARGELPTQGEGRVLDAIFVSVIDHGIVPGSIVTRYLASAGSPIQAAVGGGILSIGDTYGGAGEQLGEAMAVQLAAIGRGERDQEAAAAAIVAHFAALGLRVPGFGHPMHTQGDPRVARLMAVAEENGVAGQYCALARAVESAIAAAKRRPIPMNIDGAVCAIGLDLGVQPALMRALIMVPRSAGLAVHAVEEMQREPGWRHVPDDEVTYDGPPPRDMP